MAKIVHIAIRISYIEGLAYQENTLPAKQVEMGHEVYMLASPFTYLNNKLTILESKKYVNKDGVHVTILKPNVMNIRLHLHNIIDRCKGLYEELCIIRPDIIFVHNIGAPDDKYVIRYKKENPSVKLYADNHLDYYNSRYNNSFFRKLQIKISSFRTRKEQFYYEKIWGTTPWRVFFLEKVLKIKKEKTGLLVMGGDEKQILSKDVEKVRKDIRKQYDIPEDAFLVVTGGKLDKRKKQYLLMEAIKEMQEQNVWLLAFGSPSDEMKEVFASFNGTPNIVQTGWLPPEQGYNMFLASDLACFPGTHSVLWEQAIACSIPGVFMYWEGMSHVDVNGNAILLRNVNKDIIKETITSLINTEKYKDMKKKAKAIASTFFLSENANKAVGL